VQLSADAPCAAQALSETYTSLTYSITLAAQQLQQAASAVVVRFLLRTCVFAEHAQEHNRTFRHLHVCVESHVHTHPSFLSPLQSIKQQQAAVTSLLAQTQDPTAAPVAGA
jgi:hypothetical protein